MVASMPTKSAAFAADGSKDASGFDWATFSRILPASKDDAAAEAQRKKVWRMIDMNSNGLVSLAELDRGLIECFASEPTVAPTMARAKQAIHRSFHAAKALDQSKGRNYRKQSDALHLYAGHDQDAFVSWSEFRPLLHFLRQFLELWLMFDAVDKRGLNYSSGNQLTGVGANLGDMRIEINEFLEAVPLLEKWGSTDGRPPFRIADPRATFASIDADHSGFVRFDEFAAWALSKRLDLEDDDDVEQPDDELYEGRRSGKTNKGGDGSSGGGGGKWAVLADADQEAKDRTQDLMEQSAYLRKQLKLARKDPCAGGPNSRRKRVPESPSKVRAKMVGEARKEAVRQSLPRDRAHEMKERALRYTDKYASQYKRRMLREMLGVLRRPVGEGSYMPSQGTRLIPLYESERMIVRMERHGRPMTTTSAASTSAAAADVFSATSSITSSWAVPPPPPPLSVPPPTAARPQSRGPVGALMTPGAMSPRTARRGDFDDTSMMTTMMPPQYNTSSLTSARAASGGGSPERASSAAAAGGGAWLSARPRKAKKPWVWPHRPWEAPGCTARDPTPQGVLIDPELARKWATSASPRARATARADMRPSTAVVEQLGRHDPRLGKAAILLVSRASASGTASRLRAPSSPRQHLAVLPPMQF